MDATVTVNGAILDVLLPVDADNFTDIALGIEKLLSTENFDKIAFHLQADRAWNSRVLAAIRSIEEIAGKYKVSSDYAGLPEGAVKILGLAQTGSDADNSLREPPPSDLLFIAGTATADVAKGTVGTLSFLGAALASFVRFFIGTANFRKSDFLTYIKAAGPQALPIVLLVNLLLGVILAFMGAVQLQQFGAEIFVADLVALAQTREIAPMMTAIILAGRTGAAYAAQLGTMQVNEEVDALETFGFAPMDFLVLPRMAALAIMTPLLVLYADAIGIFGGYLIGVFLLGLGSVEYIVQTQNAIEAKDVLLGIVKGGVFGVLVAIAGCLQGIRSGRSASAVGDAATKAVVSGIIAIIVATAVFAVFTNMFGI